MIPFFHKIVDVLNELRIPYMLSGSMAMNVYIISRLTKDFDFVVYMQAPQVSTFVKQFEGGYYCDEGAVKDAVANGNMFNIIDHSSNFKADFFIMKDTDYHIEAFNRRNEVEHYERSFFLASVEDLIISKMIWVQDSQSAQQMIDLTNLIDLDNLDRIYINKWIKRLKLKTFNLLSND